MATIRPFRPLRYAQAAGSLAELVAPPYDVIDEKEQARLRSLSPTGAIHVILPTGEDRYATAARLLEEWCAKKLLERDAKPAMFVYAQRFSVHENESERWGLLTTLKLEPFDAGIVLPHERTLAAPKADRMNLIRKCRTNLSPIFGLVDTSLGLAALSENAEPIASFTDRAGVTQRLWRITDPAVLSELSARVTPEPVFIADGHHRYEVSLAYRNERRAADGDPAEHQPYDFVLAHLCSTRDPGLVVLPTHRLLSDPPEHDALLADWTARCRVERVNADEQIWKALEGARGDAPRLGALRRGHPGGWILEPAAGASERLGALAPPLRALDVTFLHAVVLPGIPADRFKYTHDEREAIAAVRDGATELAVLLPPPSVQDVLAISRAQLTMPQKSTYFYPKVLSGLVYNPLD